MEQVLEYIKYNDAEDIPLTIMINPYWENLSEETDVQFEARLIQHECDHLDGIIFIEKVEPGHSFATKEMITKFDLKNIEEEKIC